MYWYWSTRDDLDRIVIKHIVDEMKKRNQTPIDFNIRDYMKSQEFIDWLWTQDVPKDISEDEINKVDQSIKQANENDSNALADMLG